jgi:(1->4)-alpha-D-glucan 1-alpha-D-glucosylmutase
MTHQDTDDARVPRATYRVQLNEGFTLQQARHLVGYLDDLGISELYTSPFFRARRHSSHCYDLVDHNQISNELGGLLALEALSEDLTKRQMGLLLDFVPNHMGIGSGENRFWMDVLENGRSSLYSPFFDIEWSPLKRELDGRVLLPILGDYYGAVLERGELVLSYEAGAFFIRYYQTPLPLNPRTYVAILAPLLPLLLERLGEENDEVLELQSIMTGLHNLPPRWETQRMKVIERRREKEILKKRLATLVVDCRWVEQALSQRILALNGRPGEPRSFDALDALLNEQVYRLGYWRVAAEEINYRRFFDVNDLAAICVEHPQVFDEVHRLLFSLIERGIVTGLRIDHPDGLRDPVSYFAALQRSVHAAYSRRNSSSSNAPYEPGSRPLYIVAEKILSRGEALPRDWAVHGTTGYDFATLVGGLLINADAEDEVTSLYERFTGLCLDFSSLAYEKKKLILRSSLSSELNVLAHEINTISEHDRHTRDFTLETLRRVLCEVISCFPVYRTYIREDTSQVAPNDRAAIEYAVRRAQRQEPAADHSAYSFVRAVLLLEHSRSVSPTDQALYRNFVMRFQQLTGPVMAKGLEDTSFYIYNRMASLNEVGGEPEHFGVSPEKFHAENLERQQRWPGSMLSTSTHDTKRSEDVRARISVLSEVVPLWSRALDSMSEAAAPYKTELEGRLAPDKNEEHLFFQTILGTWPYRAMQATPEYIERLVGYMRKATKEAKVNTSWLTAEPEYDAAVERFVRGTLRAQAFLQEMLPLAQIVAYHGVFNSLSQTLLKLTSPGVPDLYQGTELLDDSLVDPDNRRPVDFEHRRQLLASLRSRRGDGLLRELMGSLFDGRFKLFLIQCTLSVRKKYPELFGARSVYAPIYSTGKSKAHIVAFSRSCEGRRLIVIASRLTAMMTTPLAAPIGAAWSETTLPVEPGSYFELLSGRVLQSHAGAGLSLEAVLTEQPIALLFAENLASK